MPDPSVSSQSDFIVDGRRVCPHNTADEAPGCWWVRQGHPQGEGYGCICLVPAELWVPLGADASPPCGEPGHVICGECLR